MIALPEIESAVRKLSDRDKQQLLLVIAQSLRVQAPALPESLKFTAGEVQDWIQEDDDDMERLRDRK
jgi:hypothetical protein